MRARPAAISLAGGLALLAAALAALAAACRFTSDLTGEAALDAGCDADLTRAIESCGACGRVCAAGPNAYAACVDGGCVAQCAAGFADCDEAGANGCETYVQTARSSCGRCGHDCLGGACQAGACQPIALTTPINAANAPVHIALDDTNVYGVNAYGAVTKIGKNGGTLAVLAPGGDTPQSPPPRIALGVGSAYFTSFGDAGGGGDGGGSALGSVSEVPLDGGKPAVLALGKDPFALSVSGGYAYWSEGNPSAAPHAAGIKRCKLPGCTPVTTELAAQPGRIYGLNVDANGLVWTNAGTPPSLADSAVNKCTPGGCGGSLFPLAVPPASPVGPFGLAVDKIAVYFTTTSGAVATCPLSGCGADAARLATFQATPRFIATDGAFVLWTSADGSIRSIPRGGAASERILYQNKGTSSPWDIAVDPVAVYYTDLAGVPGGPPGGAALYKLAR